MKWDAWGNRVLLDVDEEGQQLEGECSSPKFLDWKLEEIGGNRDIAWCFKPRTKRVYWKVPSKMLLGLSDIIFEDRLVCGHTHECDGQEALNV